jgi:hypothetical protein
MGTDLLKTSEKKLALLLMAVAKFCHHLFDLLFDFLFRQRHDASNDFKETILTGWVERAK